MSRAARLLATLADSLASTLAALVILYLAVRLAVGNPFAGLGAEGAVTGKAAEALSKQLGLSPNLLGGLASYLEHVFTGLRLGYSLLYSKPVDELVAVLLPYTVVPVALGVAAGYLAYVALYTLLGSRAVKTATPLAYTPVFILALPAALSAWLLGVPEPLPSLDPVKMLLYACIVAAAVSSRLLYTYGVEEGASLRYAAIGAPVWLERLRVVRTWAPHSVVYAAVLAAEALAESVVVEPLLEYPALGYLAYRALLEADVPLALATLTVFTLLSATLLTLGETLAAHLDPRLAGGRVEEA